MPALGVPCVNNLKSEPQVGVIARPTLTTPYKAISIVSSALDLSYIILGNCLCSAIACVCLWGFANQSDLTQWERRLFNTLSILFSAVLGIGIGFLSDKIGMLARGALLESRAHPVNHVGTSSRNRNMNLYMEPEKKIEIGLA